MEMEMNSNFNFITDYFFKLPHIPHLDDRWYYPQFQPKTEKKNKKTLLDDIKTFGKSTEQAYEDFENLLSDNDKTFLTLIGEPGTGKQSIIGKIEKLSAININKIKCSPKLREVILFEDSINILYSLTDLSHIAQRKLVKQLKKFKKNNNPRFKVIGLTEKDIDDEIELGCAHPIIQRYFTQNQLFIPSLRDRNSKEVETIITNIAHNLQSGPFFVTEKAMEYLKSKKWEAGNVNKIKKIFAYITSTRSSYSKYIEASDIEHTYMKITKNKKYFNNQIDWYRFKRDLSEEDIKEVMSLKQCDSIAGLATLLNMKVSTLNDRMKRLGIKNDIKIMIEKNKIGKI